LNAAIHLEMAIIAGYVSSALLLGASGLTYSYARDRARVAAAVANTPVTTVDQAFETISKTNSPAYMQVRAKTTTSDDKMFNARFSNHPAILAETQVTHVYEDRETRQTSSPTFFGGMQLQNTYSSWRRKERVADTYVTGKAAYLHDGKDAKQLVRLPAESTPFDDMLAKVAEPFELGTLRQPQQQLAPGAPGSQNVQVNVLNANENTDTFRTVGYKYRERIVPRNIPVVALGEFYVGESRDSLDGDAKANKYLFIRQSPSSSNPFILSSRSPEAIQQESNEAARTLKVTSLILAGIGASLLGGTAYFHFK